MDEPNCAEAQICRGDFWVMLEDAVERAHGNRKIVLGDPIAERFRSALARMAGLPVPKPLVLADMTLREVVDVLAQNGIRMVYLPEKHIERVTFAEKPQPLS